MLPVIFALFHVVISAHCWWKMIGQTDGLPKPGISRYWYISAVECTSSTLILQLHTESVHFVRMKPPDPWWSSKEISVMPLKQMRKVPDRGTKVVWQGHFILSWPYGKLSINMKPQNFWFKLGLPILITEKILKSTLCCSF